VAGEAAFVAIRPHGSVAVASLDGDGNPPFVFQLLHLENTVLEEVAEDRGAMNTGSLATTLSVSVPRSPCGWQTFVRARSPPELVTPGAVCEGWRQADPSRQ
jgi:hypothetical protein